MSTSQENDTGDASGIASDDPNKILISRLLKRQSAEISDNITSRSAQREASEGGVSGSIAGFSSSADALARGALSISNLGGGVERSDRGTVSRLLSPSQRMFLGPGSAGGDDGDNDDSEDNQEDDSNNESEKENSDSALLQVHVADEEVDSDKRSIVMPSWKNVIIKRTMLVLRTMKT